MTAFTDKAAVVGGWVKAALIWLRWPRWAWCGGALVVAIVILRALM